VIYLRTSGLCSKAPFNELEVLYEQVRQQEQVTLRRDDLSPVPLKYALPLHTRALFQAGLRRTFQLVDATIDEMNAKRFIPPFLTSRAALETTCVLYDTLLRVTKLIEQPTHEGIEDLSAHLERIKWGAKSERWIEALKVQPPTLDPRMPVAAEANTASGNASTTKEPRDLQGQAVNVVTIVQRVAKHHPAVWTLYEDLSELAHPNCVGMDGIFHDFDKGKDEYVIVDPWEQWASDMMTYPVAALAISLQLADGAVRWLDASIMDFVKVSERDLHERGEWPATIPYRW